MVVKRAVEKRRARDLKVRANARKTFPPEAELRALARSVMKRQIHPLIILPDNTLIDGECRYRGLMLEAPDFEADVIVADRELTPVEITEMQLVSALHSTSLTLYDQAVACKEWLDQNQGATAKELAEKIDRDASMVSKLLSLWKTTPEVIKAAQEGKIGVRAWHQISLVPTSEMGELLAMYGAGMSADQVASISRAKRNAKPEGRRVSKIKCPMQRAVVQVSGDDLSLSDLIEILTDLLKQAKKGHEDGMDAKAFMALLAARNKDKA